MRAMGLDVGTKTVGVAVSDELGITAQPHSTLARKGFKADLAALQTLAAEYGVRHIIVGLPLHMSGEEGDRSADARKLGDALGRATGIAVTYWDERLSTVAAQRALIEADVSRAKRKKVVDQVAAALILQGWLDSRRPTVDDGDA